MLPEIRICRPDVSRDVAAQAAAQTRISADALERMLPLAATLVMVRWHGDQGRPPWGSAVAADWPADGHDAEVHDMP